MVVEKKNQIGKIILGWFLVGPIIGFLILLYGGFMAGVATLVIVMTVLLLILGAPIHIFLVKKYGIYNFIGHLKVVIGILVFLFVIFVILGFSGIFNFV